MGTTYQPRYVAYCIAQGRKPEDQLQHDRVRWPGGKMTGFILWLREMLQVYAAEPGRYSLSAGIADHDHYDAWLLEQAAAISKATGGAS
ncbi:hypothetical protein [Xanthobacter tagetidis]|uniref:Uncharacterized protein n=1 Tax=Xanthobacter tagetidis TaxID=60216 RepID=A0A3L7AGE2_9HYPH|nr:hypothetical protein [Xanthobacter tagetidis]MBB6306261.1 hypothetical protein [Xanthobacter tagetidis]RLP79536.1 hypothetical protein D9R14_07690 [Xanthobacter tagetidis]